MRTERIKRACEVSFLNQISGDAKEPFFGGRKREREEELGTKTKRKKLCMYLPRLLCIYLFMIS